MTSTLKFILALTLACTLGAAYADATPPGTPASPSGSSKRLFSLAGSNTVGESLAPAWAEAFLAAKGVSDIRRESLAEDNEYLISANFRHEQVHIEIRAHGSSTEFRSLREGSADIAMSSRAIKPAELATLAPLGDLSSAAGEHVVAVDGLAIIVHPQNPISALDLHSLALIFSGKITNWKALGGPDDPISVYARDDKSGTWDTFKSLVLPHSPAHSLSIRIKRRPIGQCGR